MSKKTEAPLGILKLLNEDFLQNVAEIIGPQSGAARALEEAKRRRSDGEDVYIFETSRQTYAVGPKPLS